MIDVSMVTHVLQIAALLKPDSADGNVMAVAIERGWLDRSGDLTESGKTLCKAITDQRETRSVFRFFF